VHIRSNANIPRRWPEPAAWCETFDGGVVGKVNEHDGPFNGTGTTKVLHKKGRFFEGNTHGDKKTTAKSSWPLM
jgi:hypothetical protein